MNRRRSAILLLLFAALPLSSCTRDPAPGGPGSVRTPTFGYARDTEGGCGDVFLHKGTADRLEVLWIAADKKKLQLPDEGSRTFDLAAAPDGLQVAVDLWRAAPRFSAYCNDISPDTEREATWRAKKGRITITLHRPDAAAPPGTEQRYRASARLEGVVFEDEAGHQATLTEAIADVSVGWHAG
jgi:hypothetical protein